jgi:hypothetical protein
MSVRVGACANKTLGHGVIAWLQATSGATYITMPLK